MKAAGYLTLSRQSSARRKRNSPWLRVFWVIALGAATGLLFVKRI